MEYFKLLLQAEVFQKVYAGNSVANYLFAFGLLIIIWMIIIILRQVVFVRIDKFVKKSKNIWDDTLSKIVHKIGKIFFLSLALFIAIYFANITGSIRKFSFWFFLIFALWELIRAAQIMIDFSTKQISAHLKAKGAESDLSIFSTFLKIALWFVVGLVILDNLGYEISTFIAGLGISGIAIALAVQNILKDIFSSLSIFFDKPFKVGDYVVLGEDSGNVQKIGLQTTRITTLQGDELVVPNDILTSTKVRNFGKMKKRRIVFDLGLEYGTMAEKIEKGMELIEKVIKDVKNSEFGRCHFKEFGDFSLKLEIVYYVLTGEYVDYMDTQQEININIKKAFEKEGIRMAFPTQTVYVQK